LKKAFYERSGDKLEGVISAAAFSSI